MVLYESDKVTGMFKYDQAYGLRPALYVDEYENFDDNYEATAHSISSFHYDKVKNFPSTEYNWTELQWANRSWAASPSRLSVDISGSSLTCSNHNRLITIKSNLNNALIITPAELLRSSCLIKQYTEDFYNSSTEEYDTYPYVDFESSESAAGDKNNTFLPSYTKVLSNEDAFYEIGSYPYFHAVRSFQFVIYSDGINIFPVSGRTPDAIYAYAPRIYSPTLHPSEDAPLSQNINDFLGFEAYLDDVDDDPDNPDWMSVDTVYGHMATPWYKVGRIYTSYKFLKTSDTGGIVTITGYDTFPMVSACGTYNTLVMYRPMLRLPLSENIYLKSSHSGSISMNYLEMIEVGHNGLR